MMLVMVMAMAIAKVLILRRNVGSGIGGRRHRMALLGCNNDDTIGGLVSDILITDFGFSRHRMPCHVQTWSTFTGRIGSRRSRRRPPPRLMWRASSRWPGKTRTSLSLISTPGATKQLTTHKFDVAPGNCMWIEVKQDLEVKLLRVQAMEMAGGGDGGGDGGDDGVHADLDVIDINVDDGEMFC